MIDKNGNISLSLEDILKHGDKINDYIDSLRTDKKPVLSAPMGKPIKSIPQEKRNNLLKVLIDNATKC